MELRHLEYFVAVADEQHFTRAAARLHVVQSGDSAVIKALGRELGVALLERSSKRVELTDAGMALLPKARAVLDAVRAARDAVDEARGGLRGTVRLGVMPSVRLLDLPALLAGFQQAHPAVDLQLRHFTTGSTGLIDAVATGNLDVALVAIPGKAPAGVELTELSSSVLDLVVPAAHRLAGQRAVRISDLGNERFVDFPTGYGTRTTIDREFAAADVQRHVSLEVNDVGDVADFIRHRLGIGFMMRFAIPDDPAVRALPVEGADLRWPLSMATSTTRAKSAATQALFDLFVRAGCSLPQ
jgi:DNA-binding transcriptional LysR family regulator